MSKKEKFVFCKAPFSSIYVRPHVKVNKDYAPKTEIGFCCVQTDHYHMEANQTIDDFWKSDWAQEHRQQFLNKEWPSSCSECRWKENNGVISDIDSHDHIPVEKFSIDQGNEIGRPKYVDYRPDNLCNLMCTMCSPGNSNLIEDMWRELPINPIWHNASTPKQKIVEQEELITKELIGEHTLQLKVLGGEPTINKKVHSVFQYCIDKGYAKNIDLKITTNFTNINKTYKMFEQFKSAKINASIDATGPTYEYIRRPAKWSAVKGHMLEFGERYNDQYPRIRFSMNLVWQVANCFTAKEWIPELFDLFYVNKNIKKIVSRGDNISMINCDGTGITLEAVPDSMKHYILDDLNDLLKDWSHIPQAKLNIETLIKYTQRAKWTNEHHRAFKRKFMLMDQYKKTDMFKLSPRFKELYEYKP
tara:strand:+ start:7262 stop:8512 length:1251 start_codon:yes stop_codon:yes gene_type:complete